MDTYILIYRLKNYENESKILGTNNSFCQAIEEKYGVEILIRQGEVFIPQEKEEFSNELVNLFSLLETIFEKKVELTLSDLMCIMNNIDKIASEDIVDLYLQKNILYTTSGGRSIYPKTFNQKLYIKSLEENDIVFAIGPAGTGKTFLAVLFALKQLKTGKAKKIILVRPVVEAGEKLGFLPGDLKDKIDPYLIPLYDSLYECLGKENVEKMIDKGTIEVAPLAYMRGRTLEKAIIILDEAQNSTLSQMKMFLTRLGFNSKMIITGDVTQIDLPNKASSGLIEATSLLSDVRGIDIIEFKKDDVMRHPLVFKIIERYENK